MPRFSVIIPTRNRDQVIAIAAESVLAQTFEDFELIISDNSDEEAADRNQRALSACLQDSRVRYIRPSSVLPMTDHWEWAVSHARGSYVGILTDRMAFRLDTLGIVDSSIRITSSSLVCFTARPVRMRGKRYVALPRLLPTILAREVKSQDTVYQYTRCENRWDTPRFLNSFIARSTLDEFRDTYGSVFTGIAPDFAFLFRALDYLQSYQVINAPLLLSHSENLSNGIALTKGMQNESSNDFVRKLLDSQAHYLLHAPLQEVFSFYNTVALEYELARLAQLHDKYDKISHSDFYYASYKEALDLRANGSEHKALFQALEKFRQRHRIQPLGDKRYFRRVARRTFRKNAMRRLIARFPYLASTAEYIRRTGVTCHKDVREMLHADLRNRSERTDAAYRD